MLTLNARGRGGVRGLSFLPDGRLLARLGTGAAVWAPPAAEPVLEWTAQYPYATLPSPDGRAVVLSNYHLGLWVHSADPADPWRKRLSASPAFCARFTPDGARLASDGWGTNWKWWDAATWARARAPFPLRFREQQRFAFAPDGSAVATYGRALVRFWDTATGRFRHDMGLGTLRHVQAEYSPDGSRLVAWSFRKLSVYDPRAPRHLAEVTVGPRQVRAVAFTPDGRYVLTAANDRTVRVVEAATWTVARTYAWNVGKLGAVAVSADGLTAACGGGSGRIVVWDLDL